MSAIKWLLGGEVNYKSIEKHYRKEQQHWEERFSITLSGWNKSKNPIEIRIQNLIKNYIDEPLYPKLFFERYPDLIPNELNPFLNQESKQTESSNLEELRLKKEILEIELKLKELENSK